MTLALISKCVAYAKKATPKIVGSSIKGKKYYVIVISPDQEYDLRERDAAFAQAMREAMARGPDNPLFSGASGVWNNTVIHVHDKVAISAVYGAAGNLNGASAMFLGSGAGGIAYAKRKVWDEKTFDYGNKVGMCIGAIYGVTKAVFNSADNASVAVRTYRTSN
jgi:N4-gp56 family major capsid protein